MRVDSSMNHVRSSFGSLIAPLVQWGWARQVARMRRNDELATNKEVAVSVIAFGWYTQDTMMLRQTTVRQRWKRANGRFVLVREDVVDGDAKLIAPPAPARS